MSSSKRGVLAFTLIELLVAMSIFAVLSTFMFLLFSNFQTTREITDRNSHRLAVLQRFFSRFGGEILQVVPRPVRDLSQVNEYSPAVVGTADRIEFTRTGWFQIPTAINHRSYQQRVAYELEEHKLVRVQWPVVDRPIDVKPIRTVVLENVDEIAFRYSRKGSDGFQEYSSWPAAQENQATQPGSKPVSPETSLPHLVDVELRLQDLGVIHRKYALVREHAWQ